MEFAKRLKQLRSEKGVSQTKLAAEIHISRSAVAKWENGLGMPSDESLQMLAEYFDVTVEELNPKQRKTQYQDTATHTEAQSLQTLYNQILYNQMNTANTENVEDSEKHTKLTVKVLIAMAVVVFFWILIVILSILFPKVLIEFLKLIVALLNNVIMMYSSTVLVGVVTIATLVILVIQLVKLQIMHRGYKTRWLSILPFLMFAVVIGYVVWAVVVLRNSYSIFAGVTVSAPWLMWILVYVAVAMDCIVKSPGKRFWNIRTVVCVIGSVLNFFALAAIMFIVDWFQGILLGLMIMFNGWCIWGQALLFTIVCSVPGIIKRIVNKKI